LASRLGASVELRRKQKAIYLALRKGGESLLSLSIVPLSPITIYIKQEVSDGVDLLASIEVL
jgi:hypothetical protein